MTSWSRSSGVLLILSTVCRVLVSFDKACGVDVLVAPGEMDTLLFAIDPQGCLPCLKPYTANWKSFDGSFFTSTSNALQMTSYLPQTDRCCGTHAMLA